MQPELPCRNVGFEESLNGPFRGGRREAAAAEATDFTMADSQACNITDVVVFFFSFISYFLFKTQINN